MSSVHDTQQVLVVTHMSQADSSAEYVPPGHVPRHMAVPTAFCQCGPPSYIDVLWLMQRIHLSSQGIFNQTEGTPQVAVTVGLRVGVGVGVGVMTLMVMQLAMLSQSKVLTLRIRPAPGKQFRKTAPHCAHSLSQRPALVVIDVNVTCS